MEDQNLFCPREAVVAMRSSTLGFRSIEPANIIFDLVKLSTVILEKARDYRGSMESHLIT